MWPYSTKRWAAVRAAKLALQPVCEACGSCKRLEVHHEASLTRSQVDEKNERAAFPPTKLLSVFCKPCHSRITGGESGKELTAARQWDRFLEEDNSKYVTKPQVEIGDEQEPRAAGSIVGKRYAY